MLVSIFFFRCGFQVKIEPSWRRYLIWTADWGGEHNTPDTQNTLIAFSSTFAVMQMIFWNEDNFCFTSDSRNSFNCKFKKLINEQITIFYNPSNALISSHQSVQIIFFLSIILLLVCVLFQLHAICKCWIFVNEDAASLKQIEQMCKYALSWCFLVYH